MKAFRQHIVSAAICAGLSQAHLWFWTDRTEPFGLDPTGAQLEGAFVVAELCLPSPSHNADGYVCGGEKESSEGRKWAQTSLNWLLRQ